MYCEKCGSELQEGAQFCTSCGEMVTCPPKSETTPDDPTVETFDEAEKPLNNDQELAKVKKTHTIRKKNHRTYCCNFGSPCSGNRRAIDFQ